MVIFFVVVCTTNKQTNEKPSYRLCIDCLMIVFQLMFVVYRLVCLFLLLVFVVVILVLVLFLLLLFVLCVAVFCYCFSLELLFVVVSALSCLLLFLC